MPIPKPKKDEKKEDSIKRCMGVRFVLHPGSVRSATDGDIHWVSAIRLAGLYGVPLSKCTIAGRPDSRRYQERSGAIHLYPREGGDYKLPEGATMKAKAKEKVCKEDNQYQNELRDKHKHEYVVCVMADSKRTLTLGKTYKVECRNHFWITVINDHGKKYSFLKHRFEPMFTNKPPVSATIHTDSQPLSQHPPKEGTTDYELDPLTGAKVHPVTKQPIETYVDFSKIKIF